MAPPQDLAPEPEGDHLALRGETVPTSGDAREPDLPPDVESRFSGPCTIEELTEWIRRHPDSARLRSAPGGSSTL